MSHVRTVTGDISAAEMGITYAHEHLVIASGRMVQMSPDFLLADVDKALAELAPVRALGLRTVVDAMPADCGRDVSMLADISRGSGLNVIAATGLHHARFYDERHWSASLGADELAALFIADVEEGIDTFDYSGPIVRRSEHRAGVIKVAGSDGGPSERDEPIFEAAAIAQRATGCPILTHCEGGSGALEQMALLIRHGASPGHVLLSHVDKVVDRGYQREIAATGAVVEYDQGFRWKDEPNGTLRLLEWAAEDDLLGRVTLGLDAARQGYWTEYGGEPGWTYLLGTFAERMRERGIGDDLQQQVFVESPRAAYSFIVDAA